MTKSNVVEHVWFVCSMSLVYYQINCFAPNTFPLYCSCKRKLLNIETIFILYLYKRTHVTVIKHHIY